MSLSHPSSDNKQLIGNVAAWHLAFYGEQPLNLEGDPGYECSSDDYYAEIRATLPANLTGGSYTFTIEGMTDDDYGNISQRKAKPLSVVKLYLYWQDTQSNAAINSLKNLAGFTDTGRRVKGSGGALEEYLVAVLRVKSISRRAGTRRYEVTIRASEYIFEKLTDIRLCQPILADTTQDVIDKLLKDMLHLTRDKDYKFYGTGPSTPTAPASSSASEQRDRGGGQTPLELLHKLERDLEEASGKYGRGMFLIRDGHLHIGKRNIPFEGSMNQAPQLTLNNGFIEVEQLEPLLTDPNFNPCQTSSQSQVPTMGSGAQKPPSRAQFKVTLKGRPDIKPGDVVSIDVPPEDVEKTTAGPLGIMNDILQALGSEKFSNPANLYVTSVEHALGRTTSFATTLYGVEIKKGEDGWDSHSVLGQQSAEPDRLHGNAETQAAHAVQKLVHSSIAARNFPAVGEVRLMVTKSQDKAVGQTEKLDIGLVKGSGADKEASRLAMQRPGEITARSVPYLSPFAWGKCGLILPRYPGTRVLVNYNHGNPNDPIEVGALWEAGHGPDSEQGDWWLILPVLDAGTTVSEPEADKAPPEHTGPVSHDLITAQGQRVIEVGELTIRIADLQSMSQQARPQRGEKEQAITLEHKKAGSKITMDKDGNITIQAAKDITIDASNGTITMKAKDVDVQVQNTMNVRALS